MVQKTAHLFRVLLWCLDLGIQDHHKQGLWGGGGRRATLGDNGQTGRVQAAARIGAALMQGPLTLYGACLVAESLTDQDWKNLTEKQRLQLRSKVRGVIDCIESVDGRMLAEDKQGRTTLYFLLEC